MKSIKARKQRKAFFNAPLHQKRKQISSHLEENLLLKYDRRRLPVVQGDTVRVMRGMYKGHEDKITKVHVRDNLVDVEGVIITKADGKKVAKSIHPSNLLITKLNLTDKWRRRNLEKGLSEDKKKEIETEAKTQLKKIEEEQLKEQEALAAEETEDKTKESEEPRETQKETSVKEEKKPAKESAVKEEKKPTAKSTKESTTPKPAKQPKKEEAKEKKPSEKPKEAKPKPEKPAKPTESDKEKTKEEKA